MRSSSFRKSRSNWSDIPSVTATKLKVDAADVIEQAISEGAVAITRHGLVFRSRRP